MNKARIPELLNRRAVHMVLIAALGLLAYSNTFDASFHLDDYYNIGTNPALKDLASFTEPSKAERLTRGLYPAFKSRFFGYLTFAVNYRLHGLDVRGYHLTNLAIHVMSGLLLYLPGHAHFQHAENGRLSS